MSSFAATQKILLLLFWFHSFDRMQCREKGETQEKIKQSTFTNATHTRDGTIEQADMRGRGQEHANTQIHTHTYTHMNDKSWRREANTSQITQ